jgi:large subunit ribosomal protein L6
MSKIGKKNIILPKETSISIEGEKINIKGPKGTKILFINDKLFTSKVNEKNEFQILPIDKKNSDHKTSLLWGTYRSLINNAVIGVSNGHEKILELNGVGFRANLKGELLNLQIGFSHDVNFKIPKDVKITVEKQIVIKINGVDKELVSKIASDIKALKPIEPYKGKGIKERNQYVLRKEGKKK